MKTSGYRTALCARAWRKRGLRETGPLVAYDLETSPIPRRGSIEPRFFTLYAQGLQVATRIETYAQLSSVLETVLQLHEPGTRFVAWNANRFDLRLVMAALVEHNPRFVVHPFVAKGHGLRGASVACGSDRWLFLDGMAMLGLACGLDEFLKAFAPKYRKLKGIDFDREAFDARNPAHVAYAKRDAEGLWHGMMRAEAIMRKLTRRPLAPTIGNVAVKTFAANMPAGVEVWPLVDAQDAIVRTIVLRGGFVHCARPYEGPAWVFDLNQAYAAVMRENDLPCGGTVATRRLVRGRCGVYRVVISRAEPAIVPFYARTLAGKPVTTYGAPVETWITSIEVRALRRFGWNVHVMQGWYWTGRFRMSRFVTKLENLRRKHRAGTPVNIMVKALGCNAYGKTVERVPKGEFLLSKIAPPQAFPVEDVGPYVWFKPSKYDSRRAYHRPQLGAFITAAVRMKVFAAANKDPRAFLYADTDSVAFSRPVRLPVSRVEYGKWKRESNGERYIIIGKKVYARIAPRKVICKGLHTRPLSIAVMRRWLRTGVPPVQLQSQLLGWRKSLKPEWRPLRRSGTDTRKTRRP